MNAIGFQVAAYYNLKQNSFVFSFFLFLLSHNIISKPKLDLFSVCNCLELTITNLFNLQQSIRQNGLFHFVFCILHLFAEQQLIENTVYFLRLRFSADAPSNKVLFVVLVFAYRVQQLVPFLSYQCVFVADVLRLDLNVLIEQANLIIKTLFLKTELLEIIFERWQESCVNLKDCLWNMVLLLRLDSDARSIFIVALQLVVEHLLVDF